MDFKTRMLTAYINLERLESRARFRDDTIDALRDFALHR